ncbi:hypothetical protein PENARI_c012G02815 [Penicillium arizonense]|uniref:Protein artemis n=1 Tax=Penicillium arizonense TaxID=1835702 RepID=A0A1F5LFA6_PENAI|nr:hypothetical protein PENARI_c012G02815 [Penicillium arizonense]OGE51903.1 hypothetical protein PENARI_c012G02815 [Penicillium arizonense]
MFLIEGDGKAIIYSGDIRAEKWWVGSLIRHPILIPYTLGQKRLEKLYLDTTFASKKNPFREFPSKAEGLAELLQKVQAYSGDTVFYFRAWTFGYEDVWIALSAALNSKVHVDRYQMGLYRSLTRISGNKGASEAPALCGFDLGNRDVEGCLSNNETSRIHSCEPGVACASSRGPKSVYIMPIVNRTPTGTEIPDVGAGGGVGDLYQTHELELPDESAMAELEKLCSQHIQDQEALSQMRNALKNAFQSRRKALSLDTYGLREEGEISLENLVTALSRGPSASFDESSNPDLPNTIRFPYSRHSSYSESCEFVAAFRPKDIHPCTVDPSTWNENVSIRTLFGHLCSGNKFSHDEHMRRTLANESDEEGLRAKKRPRFDLDLSTQSTDTSDGIGDISLQTIDMSQHIQPEIPTYQANTFDGATKFDNNNIRQKQHPQAQANSAHSSQASILPSTCSTDNEDGHELSIRGAKQNSLGPETAEPYHTTPNREPRTPSIIDLTGDDITSPIHLNTQKTESQLTDSFPLSISESALGSPDRRLMDNGTQPPEKDDAGLRFSRHTRIAAYLAAREDTYSAWTDVSLVSARDNHTEEEIEL